MSVEKLETPRSRPRRDEKVDVVIVGAGPVRPCVCPAFGAGGLTGWCWSRVICQIMPPTAGGGRNRNWWREAMAPESQLTRQSHDYPIDTETESIR